MESLVKTVFIVDDDPIHVAMLADHLGFYKNQFAVKTFSSGEECLQNLFWKPDIIFLDYVFDSEGKDSMDGFEILRQIKKQSPSTYVVMFSGQDSVELATNTIKFGAFDYVVKGEGAFYRAEQIILNIIRHLKSQASEKRYMRMSYWLVVALVSMIFILIILYIKRLL